MEFTKIIESHDDDSNKFNKKFQASTAVDFRNIQRPRPLLKFTFSWYPVYFPIEKGIELKEGQEMVIDIWRCGSKKDSYRWYEWRIVSPYPSQLYNMNGAGSKIGCNS